MAEKASPLKELSKKPEEDEGPALPVKVLQKKKGDDDEEEEEDATPTPPDSSSLSSDNGTMTAVTTEEESLSTLLRHGGRDTDAEEALGVSEAQRGSTDSASFSLPSLSEGGLTAGGGGQGSEDPPLREGETLEAAGGAAAAVEAGPNLPAYYLVKWISWKEKKTPIITQSENGPRVCIVCYTQREG
ncbi:hypothetical protein JOQ06_028221 [Pogonophryne albipinna]|uniref:Uncharacterized protein n=1 Tax=Pogonophryne albipinna TaxID=1090488 RepID=A0AAD6F768_9TELE|nr:hypothetical protein JOQ06_028221 [Pogonophryne albipinna]